MASKFKIRSVLICDDIRQEFNGKEILIGLYNDVIVFPSFPAALLQIVCRISLNVLDSKSDFFKFDMVGPEGTTIHEVNGQIPKSTVPTEPYILGFAFQNMRFPAPGHYKIRLGFQNDPVEEISNFDVRMPLDSTESARLFRP